MAWTDEIGRRIREQREHQGLTRPEMADLLKVHPNTVRNWEEAGVSPFKDLQRVADILNVDMRYLLHGEIYKDQLTKIEELLERVLHRLEMQP